MMGPLRGLKKKRKSDKKPHGRAAASVPQGNGAVDWWVETDVEYPKRINGHQSPSKGLDIFESVFKVSRKTFIYICSLVKDDMMAKSGNFTFNNGKALSLYDQVAVALRRLSSGSSLMAVGDSFGLNHSTVSQITWRFVESMEEKGLHHLHWPSTETEMKDVKSKFEKIRGLPNCCGAIDITRIMMCLPLSDPTSNIWLDNQQNHSMILQAIVDSDMRFRDIITGWPGKLTDWFVFQNSSFQKLCDSGERLNGKKLEFHNGTDIREYIIGDSSYPLLPYLITPYTGNELSESKSEFNRRHSATRKVAQKALTRLKEKWRIIHGVMWRPDRHRLPRIIFVCCLLHNILIEKGDCVDEVEDEVHHLSQKQDSEYSNQMCNSIDMKGMCMRDNLSFYLTENCSS